MKRSIAWVVAMTLALSLFACSSHEGTETGKGADDCSLALRVDGVTYEEMGFTERSGPAFGKAELSSCDDSGSGRGTYFADDPEEVAVVKLAGVDPGLALAYADRGEGESLRVFVVESATDEMRQRVQDLLASE